MAGIQGLLMYKKMFKKRNVGVVHKYRGALQILISLLVLSPAMNVLLVAFLPLWLALFCILVPIAIITEVLGVLALAILQSFNPFFEEQMKLSIEHDKGLLRASRL